MLADRIRQLLESEALLERLLLRAGVNHLDSRRIDAVVIRKLLVGKLLESEVDNLEPRNASELLENTPGDLAVARILMTVSADEHELELLSLRRGRGRGRGQHRRRSDGI